ncbi:PLDc N-terminal domain-containing protein [Lacisediminihabitans sp.]|uniref:PLDc N-terminal domain-containing protein n=1 Tax=Lacisediminihabitans sp. TaxID=2787631 RepID=UPI00374CD9E1
MDSANIVHTAILFVVFAAWVALWATALASILRRPGIPSFELGAWTVIVIVVPFLGPVIWFAWGRTRSRNPASQA